VSDPTSRRLQAATFLLLALATLAVARAAPFPTDERGFPTLAPLIERVNPAVVNISVTARGPSMQNPLLRDPFFRRFFDFPEPPPRQSVGSGVIVDARRGYVLTNHHVIENAEEVLVTLQDRRQVRAELIGSDPPTDIALLQIDTDGLTELPFGDSDRLRVGDFVVAIGNPFGLAQTVTWGIVSALGRSGLNVEGYEDFIQTDASINPGNSGGALLDLAGKLVGINTAIIAPGGGNVGIGFAVPSNMAHAVMEQLIAYGEVQRGVLGILIQNLTPDLAEALGIDVDRGAVISQVQPNSSAEAAGLKPGDVVVAVDGREVTSATDLRNRIGLLRVGETVELTILRDGERKLVRVRIGEAETVALQDPETVPQLNGAVIRAMDESHPLHGEVEGVAVANVEAGSPAWRNGLREGDVIVGVNRRRVTSVEEFKQALGRTRRALALDIIRGNTRLFLVIR